MGSLMSLYTDRYKHFFPGHHGNRATPEACGTDDLVFPVVNHGTYSRFLVGLAKKIDNWNYR